MKANFSGEWEVWHKDHEFLMFDAVLLDSSLGWVSGLQGEDLVRVMIDYGPKEGELVHHSRLSFLKLYHHGITLTQIERRILVYLSSYQDCVWIRRLAYDLDTDGYSGRLPSVSRAHADFSAWSRRLFTKGLVRNVCDRDGAEGYAQITDWGRDLIRTPPPIERG